MVDRLPAICTRIYDQTVPALGNSFVAGKLARNAEEMPQQWLIFGLEGVDRLDMPVRHDQDVGRPDRMNIAECSDLIVTINDRGLGLVRNDLTEMA